MTKVEIEDALEMVQHELNDLEYELHHFAYTTEEEKEIRERMERTLKRRDALQAQLR
jgi:hypothetical protein